jgi:cell division protein FtsB
MTRAGTPTVAELMALLAANAAENAALRAERDALEQRVFKLEEELALAQLHRFAPRSEKHLVRIYDALKQRLLLQNVIHGDETTVQVLKEKDRKATDESYIWAYRSGQDSLEPVVLLEYQPGRGQVHPQTFLGDYRGILMSDGYQGWRTLKGATHVGCMAHARRRFVNAFKAGKKPSGPPVQALKLFDQLYRIERQARDEKPMTAKRRPIASGACARSIAFQSLMP